MRWIFAGLLLSTLLMLPAAADELGVTATLAVVTSDVPAVVTFPRHGLGVLKVRLTLHNPSDGVWSFEAQSPCRVLVWAIIKGRHYDAQGQWIAIGDHTELRFPDVEVVENHSNCAPSHIKPKRQVLAHSDPAIIATFRLNADLYEDGGTYTFYANHWGYETRKEFTVRKEK